jgi:uncharacterized protein YecT (DUF1311 family)
MTQPPPTVRFRLCLRQVFLTVLLIALAWAAWPAAAQDDEQPRWFGNRHDDLATLAYGVPDSDYVMLSFGCTPGAGTVDINIQDEHSGTQADQQTPIRLQAGGRHVEFSARGTENQDSGGVDFNATLPLDDTLRHMLSARDSLDITIKNHTERYPLTGATEPAARLLAACEAPKPSSGPGSSSAAAQSIPASFDCAKAERPVDRLICGHAALRWQDLALSRAYTAAKTAATGSARDDLVRQQRDWVRERDRRCIADRSFKELSSASSPLAKLAYDCLDTVYLDRRRVLQDLGSPPLMPSKIAPLDLAPMVAARPDIRIESDLRIADIQVSPDDTLLAILLPSQEIDGPDQVWLYRVADGKLTEATPRPDQQQPHPDGAPMAIQALAWQDGTLYARVALWGKGDNPERNASAVYAATIEGHRPLDTVPSTIQTLLDQAAASTAVETDQMPESDQDALGTLRGNRDFLAWTVDLGHGTLELRTRKRTPDAPVYRAAWGAWELGSFLFDARRSRIVYAADTGITLLDLATRGAQRIAGTSRGDLPYAHAADQKLFVWSTRNACGDEFLAPQDDSAPQRYCLAHLAAPKARP